MTKYLAIGAAVLVAIAGILGWLLKESYAANGALEAKLSNAQAIIDQREQDAKDNAKAVAQLAQKLNDTETKVITVTEKVYAAPVTRECAQSPAMRAASDGMRQLFAPTEPAPGGRQPFAAVPGPSAGPGERQR